jgi:hypothetical protein
MKEKTTETTTHPTGESVPSLAGGIKLRLPVDTFGGRIHVEWDPQAAVTPLGQLPFFIEFLKVGGLFDPWVQECPLNWQSPNAPRKRDVLGTFVLSILSGHKRYAHITSLRSDEVNARLLGMDKVVSEDSARRALSKMSEGCGVHWLQRHLQHVYSPVLQEPWILDADTTVKPLYGKQEGAVVGYNPHKPGRPSHTYHTYMIANLRLVLDVEVQAGNRHTSKHSAPGLWSLLDRVPRNHWPAFIRGDRDWGTDGVMHEAEQRGLPYLFKLRATRNVKRLIERLMLDSDWAQAGQGWEGKESRLRLHGWLHDRRVIVLRRALPQELVVITQDDASGQLELGFTQVNGKSCVYEYAILATSLDDEILTIAQHYRDRADSENNFDELKNHWGWGGFTTQDIKRCRFIARMVALVYNWWSLFVRLADPNKHTEAITSRPLLLHAVGKQTQHAGQTTLVISTTHGKSAQVRACYQRINRFLKELKSTAEQLNRDQRWCRILSQALVKYLHGRQLKPPNLALAAP